jgi:B-cell receptor-associated protein 31
MCSKTKRTGFTLFLSVILTRTYSLVMDLLKAQEELAVLKQQGAGPARGDKHLEEKLVQLQAEYDALAVQKGNTTKTATVKKVE